MTRTPLSRSKGQKVKGQGHQAALLTAVLAHQAAAAVGVGTCWTWETAATLPSAHWRKALRRPRGGEGWGISWRPPAYRLLQKAPMDTRISQFYTNFNTMPLPDLHKFQILKFVHKFIHHQNQLPPVYYAPASNRRALSDAFV